MLRDPTRFSSMGDDAEKLFKLHAQRIQSVHADVAQHRRDKEADADSVAPNTTLRRALGRGIDDAVDKYERARVKASDEDRMEPLRELHKLDAMATKLEPLFASPKVLSTRHAAGSGSRARFAAEYARCGIASLGTHAAEILATGNKDAAAAFVAHVDSLSAKYRPKEVSTTAISDAVFGADWRVAQGILRTVRNRVREAVEAERVLVSGRTNGASKIAAALARRKEGVSK